MSQNIIVTHQNECKSILCIGGTQVSIFVNPECESAKIECFPFYFYFDSLDEVRDIRDMLDKLLELAPEIRHHVPRHSSAVYTGTGEKK